MIRVPIPANLDGAQLTAHLEATLGLHDVTLLASGDELCVGAAEIQSSAPSDEEKVAAADAAVTALFVDKQARDDVANATLAASVSSAIASFDPQPPATLDLVESLAGLVGATPDELRKALAVQ